MNLFFFLLYMMFCSFNVRFSTYSANQSDNGRVFVHLRGTQKHRLGSVSTSVALADGSAAIPGAMHGPSSFSSASDILPTSTLLVQHPPRSLQFSADTRPARSLPPPCHTYWSCSQLRIPIYQPFCATTTQQRQQHLSAVNKCICRCVLGPIILFGSTSGSGQSSSSLFSAKLTSHHMLPPYSGHIR